MLPTLTVMGVLLLVDRFTQQTFLFASLASSAFLIYRDPEHGMTRVTSLVPAHLLASVIGLVTFTFFGEGHLSGAVSMVITITLLIALNIMHPPAVSTSLVFAFRAQQESAFTIFLLALFMVTGLYVVHLVGVRLVHRMGGRRL